MNSKPILFSGDMIRALLDGRKTQTRRVIKPQPMTEDGHIYENGILGPETYEPVAYDRRGEMIPGKEVFGVYDEYGEWGVACPYGQPGDLLWIREHWRTETDYYNDLSPSELSGEETIIYEADGDWSANHTVGRFRQSMHMPRWASRLTLRITDVRVERVQDISDKDAKAEGAPRSRLGPDQDGRYYREWRVGFWELWDSINAANGYGWKESPWVWVIEFEVIHKNIDSFISQEAA